jgi:hypothetical protein
MKSGDNEKKPKVGPREAQLRAMREARVEKNKVLIDRNVKEIRAALGSKVKAKVKTVAGKVKARAKTKVAQFKAKRGRSGR